MTVYPRSWTRRGLYTLLVLVFVVVQATALAHEVNTCCTCTTDRAGCTSRPTT
jgi:hypothetical protein